MNEIAIQNGGVVLKDGLCAACCQQYGSTDCCCFLDPDVNIWEAIITYAEDDYCWHEDGRKRTFRSKQNNNLNHTPSVVENEWWEVVSDSAECGNADWDKHEAEGYGGYGLSPYHYTLNLLIKWQDSGRRTHLNMHLAKSYPSNRCHWVNPYPPGAVCDEGVTYVIGRVMLRGSSPWFGTNYMVYLRTASFPACNNSGLFAIPYRMELSIIYPTIDYCETEICLEDIDYGCAIRWYAPNPAGYEWGLIDLCYRPGYVPEWDVCAVYLIGKIVGWNGAFYMLITEYSPGVLCDTSIEPGVHEDWELYWELV